MMEIGYEKYYDFLLSGHCDGETVPGNVSRLGRQQLQTVLNTNTKQQLNQTHHHHHHATAADMRPPPKKLAGVNTTAFSHNTNRDVSIAGGLAGGDGNPYDHIDGGGGTYAPPRSQQQHVQGCPYSHSRLPQPHPEQQQHAWHSHGPQPPGGRRIMSTGTTTRGDKMHQLPSTEGSAAADDRNPSHSSMAGASAGSAGGRGLMTNRTVPPGRGELSSQARPRELPSNIKRAPGGAGNSSEQSPPRKFWRVSKKSERKQEKGSSSSSGNHSHSHGGQNGGNGHSPPRGSGGGGGDGDGGDRKGWKGGSPGSLMSQSSITLEVSTF